MVKPWSLMPGPKAYPIFGSLLRYSRFGKFSFDRMHESKMDGFQKYGKIYREQFGPSTIVQLFDPADICRVFRAEGKYPNRPVLPIVSAAIKRGDFNRGIGHTNGEEWHRLRQSVNKLMMSVNAASSYLPRQNEVADDLVTLLRNARDGGTCEVKDVRREIIKYTIEAFGCVCFDERLGVLVKEFKQGSLAHRIHTAVHDMFEATQKTTFAFPWYNFFKTKHYVKFIESHKTLDMIAFDYIDSVLDQVKRGETGGEFLRTLLYSGISKEEAICITTDLFTAGIDSTGNALSFVLYNLAKHPEEQNELHGRIESLMNRNSPVTEDILKKMSYLKACVTESFRLNFPTEGGTTRILERDLELGGYLVPKGTMVATNNQTMCLQREWFVHESEYRPQRWLHKTEDSTLKRPPPFVMTPFGYGPRMCIGRRFAEQEIFLAVIKIIQNFELKYNGEEIGMLNRIFTAPNRDLCIKFIDR